MSPASSADLRGADKPRVEIHPPYSHTYGPLATKLCAAAGQTMDPWQQDALNILLSHDGTGRWCCADYAEIVARQNGKGAILEARVLFGFLVLGEPLIAWSAHEYKTASKAFKRLKKLFRALGTQPNPKNENLWVIEGIPIKFIETNGEQGFIRLDTYAEINFIARSKGSGRGFSGDLIIIDEAYAFTREQQEALEPTVAAIENPQIIYTSSPPLDGVTGEPLFTLRDLALSDEPGALGFRDWGLNGTLDDLDKRHPDGSLLIDLDDHANWALTNPALGRRGNTIAKLKGFRRKFSPVGFAREFLGVWPKQIKGGGAIDVATWAGLTDPQSQREGDIAIAVDIAPKRDYAAIAVYGLRDDELGHLQLVDYRPGTDWIIERLVELRDTLDPVAIGMGRGTAATLETPLEELGITRPEDPDEPMRGDLFVTTALEMGAACGQMIDAVKQRSFRHKGQGELDSAVSGAQTKESGEQLAWVRKDAETDVTPLVAASVARLAFVERAHRLHEELDPADSVW